MEAEDVFVRHMPVERTRNTYVKWWYQAMLYGGYCEEHNDYIVLYWWRKGTEYKLSWRNGSYSWALTQQRGFSRWV